MKCFGNRINSVKRKGKNDFLQITKLNPAENLTEMLTWILYISTKKGIRLLPQVYTYNKTGKKSTLHWKLTTSFSSLHASGHLSEKIILHNYCWLCLRHFKITKPLVYLQEAVFSVTFYQFFSQLNFTINFA